MVKNSWFVERTKKEKEIKKYAVFLFIHSFHFNGRGAEEGRGVIKEE